MQFVTKHLVIPGHLSHLRDRVDNQNGSVNIQDSHADERQSRGPLHRQRIMRMNGVVTLTKNRADKWDSTQISRTVTRWHVDERMVALQRRGVFSAAMN